MNERMELDFSDQELVGEIRAGSAVAFERLMRRYEKLVYKVAYGLTGNRDGEDFEEVVQLVPGQVVLRAERTRSVVRAAVRARRRRVEEDLPARRGGESARICRSRALSR